MAANLLCTVRDCGQTLASRPRTLTCLRGHSFDVARSGYVNLLQPQDRRSRTPGDARDVVAARGRLLARGSARPLLEALDERLRGHVAPGGDLLDVGCGEGSLLAKTAARTGLLAHGCDLSLPAIETAARSWPEAHWVVANADRMLPWETGAFAAALSINARLPAAELARVLGPGGLLLVALPGPDDLAELRAAMHGSATALAPERALAALLAGPFEVLESAAVGHRLRLNRAALADALAASYRGARHSARSALAALAELDVTFAWQLVTLRRRTGAG